MAAGLAFAATIFFSRAWLIHYAGSSVPFLDQWSDAELIRSWLTHTLQPADLVAPHNEHRIALTRLANLALFSLGARWEPLTQLVLNAVLHAATAALIFAGLSSTLEQTRRALIAAALALLFSTTAGWQNALWGFQSQVYFGNLLAIAAFALLVFSPNPRLRLLAILPLALGLLANAGGLLGAAVAAIVALMRPRRFGPLLLLLVLAIVAIGIALQTTPPAHLALRAQSLPQFASVFVRCLSWPFIDSAWLWLVLHAPLLVLAWLRWRRRMPWTSADHFALCLVLFALSHAAAIAYSRGGGLLEARPLSRYQDPLVLGVAGQVFAALRLSAFASARPRFLLGAWAAVLIGGLAQLTTVNLSLHLPFKRLQDAAHLEQIRAYLASGEVAHLAARAPFAAPYPDARHLGRLLDDPILRPFLPRAFTTLESATPPPIRHAPTCTIISAFLLLIAIAPLARRPPRSQRPDSPVSA